MLGTPARAHPGRRGRPPGRSTLDPDSPLPLWAQLRADLRGRLARGEFDQRFPTERELTAVYEVSRHTVREAVRHLRADGLVERRRGLGTFVVKTEFEQPLGSLYSLFRFVEAQGVEQRSSVLVAEVRSDETVAGKLGLEPGSELFYLERIRYAGDAPLALDSVWLPAEPARPLLEADFRRTALYDELARRCGIVLVGGRERIHPVIPTPSQRAALELPPGLPAFLVKRLGHTAERAIEWRTTLVRGDRYSFVAEWSARGGGRPLGFDGEAPPERCEPTE